MEQTLPLLAGFSDVLFQPSGQGPIHLSRVDFDTGVSFGLVCDLKKTGLIVMHIFEEKFVI
jgi:hypothetical protein